MDSRTSTSRSLRRRTAFAATLLTWAAVPVAGGFPGSLTGALLAQSAVPVVRVAPTSGPAPSDVAVPPILRRPPLDVRVAPEGALHRVILSDGRVYYGSVLSGGNPVRIGFPGGGTEEIPSQAIVRIEEVQGTIVDGEFWPRDPNHSRLIFAPTGRNLPRGTGSANAFYGVMPFVALGLTDRLTLAGGVSLLKSGEMDFFPSRAPLTPDGGDRASPGRTIHLAPKLQVLRGRRMEAAVGALVFMPTRDPGSPSGIVYTVGTFGIDDRTAVTLAAGLGLRQGEWQEEATWMVGADHRVSRRIKLVTENYRFPGGETLHMGGVRLLGEQLSADLAVALRPGATERQALPVLNISFGW
jgi:hypothetical protein